MGCMDLAATTWVPMGAQVHVLSPNLHDLLQITCIYRKKELHDLMLFCT